MVKRRGRPPLGFALGRSTPSSGARACLRAHRQSDELRAMQQHTVHRRVGRRETHTRNRRTASSADASALAATGCNSLFLTTRPGANTPPWRLYTATSARRRSTTGAQLQPQTDRRPFRSAPDRWLACATAMGAQRRLTLYASGVPNEIAAANVGRCWQQIADPPGRQPAASRFPLPSLSGRLRRRGGLTAGFEDRQRLSGAGGLWRVR